MNRPFRLVCVTVLASACSGDPATPTPTDDVTSPPPEVQSLTVDVSGPGPTHVDLASGSTVDISGDWHLAIEQTEVFTNGGTSGPGFVAVGLAVPRDDLYDADGQPIVEAFTAPESATQTDLSDPVPAPPAWVTDSLFGVFGEDWFTYNGATGIFEAVSDVGWLVRSGEGDSYARLRFTALDFPSRDNEGVKSFTISLDVQPSGQTLFDGTAVAFEGAIGFEGGDLCFDFDSDATVDCAGTSWDILLGFVGRDFYMYTNSGVLGEGSGGAVGPVGWDALQGYTSATTDPQGTDLTNAYRIEAYTSQFLEFPWLASDLVEAGDVWPNYRVYTLDTDVADDDAARFALQVLGYEAGQMSLTWRSLLPDEAVP